MEETKNSKVISSICFVPNGCFNLNPKYAKVSPDEIMEYEKQLGQEAEERDQSTSQGDDFVEKIDFESEYMKSLQKQVITNDPRFPVNNNSKLEMEDDEDDSEEEEDYTLSSTDTMFFMNSNTELVSTLDVWVHQRDGSTFMHHNNMINSHILCLDWMNYHPSTNENVPRNLALVGTFLPKIEIWDLDVVDDIRPISTFQGHKAGTMSIHWNRKHRNMFASGSEDQTAKVWDVKKGTCVATVNFPEKVSRIKWNETNSTFLLSTIFNNSCCVYDPRKRNERMFFKVKAPPEDAVWNPWDPNVFYCSLSSGEIMGYDIRQNGNCLFVFQAHQKECNALDFNNRVPNMLFSCGSDGFWKVYNCGTRNLFFEKKVQEKNIYSIKSFNNLVVVGGENINTTYNLQKQPKFQSIFNK